MNPIIWWMAAQTVLTAVALVLAVAGWLRRPAVVERVERPADTAVEYLPLLADRITEATQEMDAVIEYPDVDEDLHGRHVLVESTATMPPVEVGHLRIPPYYFAGVKEDSR